MLGIYSMEEYARLDILQTVRIESLYLRVAKVGRESLRMKFDQVITFSGLPDALFYQNYFFQRN